MAAAKAPGMTILERALVWDNHACMPLRPNDDSFLPELRRLRDAGVNAVGLNVGFGGQGVEEHLRMLAHFRHWLKARPGEYLLIRTSDDVLRAKESGRLGVFFDIEGANGIADQLSLIELYYDLGVRWMLVAYNLNNRAGGGCLDEDPGLSEFGGRMIDEMNRVGMVLCCSHTGERTALEAIERSAEPVIFSHSNPRAMWDHPRNIRDNVIRACAQRGGVIGINGIGHFLGNGGDLSETLARHVDYVAALAGIDHVAIGLDYVFDTQELIEYLRNNPELFGKDARSAETGFHSVAPEQLHDVVATLSKLGYSDGDLEKILGLNLLRIARAVWK
jgi:membrane dipeptidase